MGISIYDIPNDKKNEMGFYRFNELNGTCPENLYNGFIDGIFKKFEDSFFFVNLIQCFIVILMYFKVGKGKYWRILFYAAIAGGIATILENTTIAYICREQDINTKREWIVSFFIAEFFWIVVEYSIPFLNLIKMEALTVGRFSKIINYTIIINFFLFAICRFWIGYSRMRYGIIQSADIALTHAFAFIIMAISDLICTFSILFYVRKHNKNYNIGSSITTYIKFSSYTILICVDIVSILLAIFYALTQYRLGLPDSIVNPFHCLKSGFILILAADSLIFKYGANNSSNDIYRLQYNNEYGKSTYNKSQYQKSQPNYNMKIDFDTMKSRNASKNSIKSKTSAPISNISTNNYSIVDPNDNEYNNNYQNKSIIKNFTNIKPIKSEQPPTLFGSIYNFHNNSKETLLPSKSYYNNLMPQNDKDNLISKRKR